MPACLQRITRPVSHLLLTTVFLGGCGATDATVPPTRVAFSAPPSPAERSGVSSYRSTRTHDAVAGPVRLRIPSINVNTGLEELRRAADQTIQVPRDPDSAGWWADGPRPGQVGPAVILGHVDSKTGPAVFFRLVELAVGADILVDLADGTTVRFTVTVLDRYRKDEFPTDLVYYPTLDRELRLVTCGGPIDPTTGHYRDNLVVFAVRAA
jgi:sortase (surface protein transpeptidase)